MFAAISYMNNLLDLTYLKAILLGESALVFYKMNCQ